MAKSKTISASTLYREKPKTKRPGVHAKSKFSKVKTSKHYKKLSRGQG